MGCVCGEWLKGLSVVKLPRHPGNPVRRIGTLRERKHVLEAMMWKSWRQTLLACWHFIVVFIPSSWLPPIKHCCGLSRAAATDLQLWRLWCTMCPCSSFLVGSIACPYRITLILSHGVICHTAAISGQLTCTNKRAQVDEHKIARNEGFWVPPTVHLLCMCSLLVTSEFSHLRKQSAEKIHFVLPLEFAACQIARKSCRNFSAAHLLTW